MDDTEIDFKAIFGLLRRQFRLIATTIAVVIGFAAIAAFALPSLYSASALILVDPRATNLLDPDAVTTGGVDSARIDSEVELARSDNVLLRAIADENLVEDREFGATLGLWERMLRTLRLGGPTPLSEDESRSRTLDRLRPAVDVSRRGLTHLIAIEVNARDPAKAARIANGLANAYIADQLAAKVDAMLMSRRVLEARITQARDGIIASERAFDDFIGEQTTRIAEGGGNADLTATQERLKTVAANRTRSAGLASLVESSRDAGDWDTIAASLPATLGDLTRRHADTLHNLEIQPSGSPAETSLRAELAGIEEQLRDSADAQLTTLRQSLEEMEAEEQALRETLRAQILNSDLPADTLTRLYEMQQNSELARSQYQTLLSRIQDVEAQADLQLADSRIVSPALPPQSPASPNRGLIISLAGLAGLGLGIGLAFLYENWVGGFTDEAQVEAVLHVPVASTVPLERDRAGTSSLADLVVSAPLSAFSESIRRMRAAVQAALGEPPNGSTTCKVIMVTSATPGEGKTTLALALARSYALFGQRTLLIDCDLRKPGIHHHLDQNPAFGLLDYLSAGTTGDMDPGSILSRDGLTAVTVIVGAHGSDQPTDRLLAGPIFQRLIETARAGFDVIVLDTPPVGPVVDDLYIAPLADAAVFVTQWASTSQQDARKSLAALRAALPPGAPIVGVLNQQDDSQLPYGQRYSGYFVRQA